METRCGQRAGLIKGTMRHPILLTYTVLVVLLSARSFTASAQHDPYEVLFNGITQGEPGPEMPRTSEELFLGPLGVEGGLFGELTGYGVASVRYYRRGLSTGYRSVSLMGADISGNLNSSPDYGVWSALGRLRLEESAERDALWFTGSSAAAARRSYRLNPDAVPDRRSVGAFATSRKGRAGVRGSVSGTAAGKLTYMADLYRRWGRDATVKGAFTDKTAYAVALSYAVAEGHRLTVVSAGERGEDGLRSYVTREVLELTGDNYYNPSWGRQDSKVRNSRVTRGCVPVTALSYEAEPGGRATFTVTVAYRGGTESVSGLSWLDAATPYPDYYRYLPSHASSLMAYDLISAKWRAGEESVTQVDWGNFHSVNSMNTSTAVYTLSDRVEKVRDLQAFAAFGYRIDEATEVGFTLRARSDRVRRFRRMKDLLGGLAVDDIDQYLYEDEIYGGQTLNNVREPYRKVSEGDVFGYDYDMNAVRYEGSFRAAYDADGLTVSGTAGFGYTAFRRRGRYEKELYPGSLSYGPSGTLTYETYFGEVDVRYALSPGHALSAYIHGDRSPPEWATHFISPMYSNRTTGDDPRSVTTLSAEAAYNFRSRIVRATASVYYTAVKGRDGLYNYWDDISSAYSAMYVRGQGEMMRGAEVAADVDFHPRWNLAGAAALGSYKFTSDPEVDIYSENTLQKYVEGARSYLKGYHTGRSPGSLFVARLSYNGSGLSGGLTFNYIGMRYVAPSPLRRMQRAWNLALTDEATADFVAQEKLGDAFTVDFSIMKSFRVRASGLTLFLSASNLLNNRDIVYGAYEQMRITRRGSGVNAVWVPMGNKYLYSYGRTWYLSATWSF